jgi:DNA-binding transcriptional MocR family regulator
LGLQVDEQELIITNGAQEALSIALQCVAKAGDIIAVESPVYFGILELVESLDMMVLEIPLCPEDGIWLEDLERGIAEHSIKACLFSASISNPLGSFMNKDKQRQIVELLEQHDIPLIEDDVYGDLYFTEKRGSTAQLFSKKGLVMTCSSFSKTAAPGYRVGWLLPGKFGDQAKRFKRALSCASPTLSQWVLSEYIASGEYDRNTQLLRQTLLLNKQRMIAAVTNAFPPDTRISNPKGAGVLWIELPVGNESEAFFHSCLQQNVSIAPGSLFSPSDKFKRCIRLSYGIEWSREIEAAIKTIGRLCK